MEFSERLVKLLKETGVTQRELAKRIGINEAAMSKYVSGVRKPRMDILANIARELSVSIEYLLGQEKEESYTDIRNLIFRNVNNLTMEQKLELMKIISSGGDK